MRAAALLPSPRLAGLILDRVCREQLVSRREATEAIAHAGVVLGLVPRGGLN